MHKGKNTQHGPIRVRHPPITQESFYQRYHTIDKT